MKEAKKLKSSGQKEMLEAAADEDGVKGLLFYEYDLMLHFVFGHLRGADGAYPPNSQGVKAMDLFAGKGKHRCYYVESIYCRV